MLQIVRMINVNYNSGSEALKKSVSLNGYAFLISLIRKYESEGCPRDDAIVKAIDICIKKGILVDFLKNRHKEVSDMLTYQYSLEEELEVLREESLEEGHEKGRIEGLEEGLEKGRVEGQVKAAINVIKTWKVSLGDAMEAVELDPKHRERTPFRRKIY